MKQKLLSLVTVVCGILFLSGSVALLPTVSGQGSDKNERGRKLYYQYCASCHGTDATGNGPAATAMKNAPPSLKNLKDADGKYPALKVKNIIAGEVDVTAHGSREMPVWGRYFREKKGSSEAQLDIYALTKYLESFQPK